MYSFVQISSHSLWHWTYQLIVAAHIVILPFKNFHHPMTLLVTFIRDMNY